MKCCSRINRSRRINKASASYTVSVDEKDVASSLKKGVVISMYSVVNRFNVSPCNEPEVCLIDFLSELQMEEINSLSKCELMI